MGTLPICQQKGTHLDRRVPVLITSAAEGVMT
jgi:hypothetical protein